MKFLLDESAEVQIAQFLESLGHDVKVVHKDYPIGIDDTQILSMAHSEQRIVITNDRDFGELVFKRKHPHSRVIYFRFPLDSGAVEKINALKILLSTHTNDLNKFLTINPRSIRVRT